MNFNKFFFVILIIFPFSSLLVARDFDNYATKNYIKSDTQVTASDDFDDLFNDTVDVVVEEKKEAPKPENVSKPITFSGWLKADVGLGFSSKSSDYFNPAAIFSMTNYIYMTARAGESLGIRGSIETKFPSFTLNLYELYFEYLLLDKIFIQAGKRNIPWGNLILKENNLLYDSKNGLSICVSVPIWKLNFTVIGMYQTIWGHSSFNFIDYSKTINEKIPMPSKENLSFAASIESVLGPLHVNVFGRKWADADKSAQKPALGMETKLSIKGYDLYNQTVVHSHFDGSEISNCYLDKITCKTGFMKDWQQPRIGFDIEYHYTYYNKDIYPSLKDLHEIYFKGLVSRLFKNTSKIGLSAVIDITNNTGTITPGYIFYKIIDTELRVAMPISYTATTWSITPVVYLEFDWHY
ncbi:MAG: hypothetical protein ACTTHG_01290 [Treponemataceae bacterium]